MGSKAYFAKVANEWDRMRSDFFSVSLRDKALSLVEPQEGAPTGVIAADIGAGTGFMTEGLLARKLKVIAVDQSPEMLEVLKEKLAASGPVEIRVGEAGSLPLAEHEVDYVFANMYLHHVENPADSIREMARVLKPGGSLVLTDLDSHNFTFLLTEHNDRWPGFERKDVLRWLNEAGLKGVKVECANEDCCSTSQCGDGQARISVFLATGRK